MGGGRAESEWYCTQIGGCGGGTQRQRAVLRGGLNQNSFKKVLKWLCDFVCCLSTGGEGSKVARVPLVIIVVVSDRSE